MRIAAVATLYTTFRYVLNCSVENFVQCSSWKLKESMQIKDSCVQSVLSLKNKSVQDSYCSVQNVQDISLPLYKGSLVLNILYTAVRILHLSR